ncbi:hypothetical protein ACFVHB_35855 [Kitasatospora sp. NPDC127111]|uniref:hypothetical protein n=1 Tax=Kitasatospora sp. NPDC127111 TaxID=3345363 RepID=UPI00362683D0
MSEAERQLPPLRAGRQPAGIALLNLLDDPKAPRLCVVSGSQGVGKTHLLTWLVAACSIPGCPAGRRPDAALSLAGMTADAAVWLLAARLGVYARTVSDLVLALRDGGPRPRLLLLWDLNRSAAPEAIAARVLGPLLDVPGLRVVAEAAHGVWDSVPGAATLVLDEPRWTDRARFSAWYGKQRGASPFDAGDVYPSPGLARLAAAVPAEVAGQSTESVHAAWWAAAGERARLALAALAGAVLPLTSAQWSAIAGADAVEDAARLLPADSTAGGTWWLPEGPLRDTVMAGTAPVELTEVARALAGTVPRGPNRAPDYTRADPAGLGIVLRQAVHAGMADEVLNDIELLVHTDPVAVTTALTAHSDTQAAKAWSLAGPALINEPDPAARALILRRILLSTPPASENGNNARITAEAALTRLASGEGNPSELLTALLDGELLVCPDAETGALLVTTGANGRDGVDACTSQSHVPRHWAGSVRLTGRDLAARLEGLDVRLNPASLTSLIFPLHDLRRFAESAG